MYIRRGKSIKLHEIFMNSLVPKLFFFLLLLILPSKLRTAEAKLLCAWLRLLKGALAWWTIGERRLWTADDRGRQPFELTSNRKIYAELHFLINAKALHKRWCSGCSCKIQKASYWQLLIKAFERIQVRNWSLS